MHTRICNNDDDGMVTITIITMTIITMIMMMIININPRVPAITFSHLIS